MTSGHCARDEDGLSIMELTDQRRGVPAHDEKLDARNLTLEQRQDPPNKKQRRVCVRFVRHEADEC